MRIVGWPEEPDSEGGIDPIPFADVDLHAAPEELRAIGNLLLKAAAELEAAQSSNSPRSTGIELRNSNPSDGVGLTVNVAKGYQQ